MSEYLPRALLVGVSYSDFWGLTPRKLEPFYKSFQERQKAEADRDNQKAWLNGVYVFKAIVAALSSKQSNRYYPFILKLHAACSQPLFPISAWKLRPLS